jgi:hypothetical protein
MTLSFKNNNLMLISYPSGGFGNFLFYVLTEFSNNTVKVDNTQFKFGPTGNSHSTKKYTDVYFYDPDKYTIPILDPNKLTLILCDNGINNDSYEKIKKTFLNARIIRAVIDSSVRPIIYQTCIVKAKNSNLVDENKMHVLTHWNDFNEDYAKRENFTLMYHQWPFKWNKVNDPTIINLSLEYLITNPVGCVSELIKSTGGQVINKEKFIDCCHQWKQVNQLYFKIYYEWEAIKNSLENSQNIDISHITDLHEQGYINYCIECKFNVIIPVYDYKNWFTCTEQIQKMVNQLI